MPGSDSFVGCSVKKYVQFTNEHELDDYLSHVVNYSNFMSIYIRGHACLTAEALIDFINIR